MDEAVNSALCAGMNILGVLEYTTRSSVTRQVPVDSEYYKYLPDNIQDWAALVRAVVNHYPQIRYWSVWNEPNGLGFFRGYGWEQTSDDLVPAYEALVQSAAPGIRENYDGQGRRYLVGPELAADETNNGAGMRFLQRVLADQGNNIDVVALHYYGSAGDVQNYVLGVPSRAAPPTGWRWPIWLTEVGLPGCNDVDDYTRQHVLPYTAYCVGALKKYTDDTYLAGYVDSLMRATRNAYLGGWTWAKTFYWHANEEVYQAGGPPPGDTLVKNNRGLIGGTRANSLYARSAYSAFSAIAGAPTLRASGPDYGYDEYVTVTAAATPPSSYYYVWEYKWCYNGYAPHDCDGQWYHFDEGQNLTAVSTFMHRQDYYIDFRARQSAYQNGPEINESEWDISGAGVCSYPQGCDGAGGGGMYAGIRRNTVYNDTTKGGPGPDPSAQRMKGNPKKGGR